MTGRRAATGRGALWSLVDGGLSQALALAVFLVTARFVDPHAFGLIAICYLVIELFRQLVTEPLALTVNSRHKPARELFDACFAVIMAASVVAAGLTYFSAGLIADLLHIPDLAGVLEVLSVLLITLGLSRTHEIWLVSHLRYKALAIRSLVSFGLGGAFGVALAIQGFGVTSLIVQQLVTAASAVVALWLATQWRPRLRIDLAIAANLVRFARHLSLNGVLNYVYFQADTSMIAYFLGAGPTGLYNSAKRITTAINQMLATPLNRVVMPALAEMWKDKVRERRVFLEALSLTSLLTAPAFAGIAALAPDIVNFVMGEAWAAAASVLSAICIAYYLTTITQYCQAVMVVHDRPYWLTWLTILSSVLNVVLVLIAIRWGITMVALAFAGRALIVMPLYVAGAVRLLEMSGLAVVRALLPSAVLAGMMGALVAAARIPLIDLPTWERLGALVAAGVAIYVGGVGLFARRTTLSVLALAKDVLKR